LKPTRRKRWLPKVVLCALVLLVGALPFTPAHDYQRAASLLLRVNNPDHPNELSEFGVYPVDETVLNFDTPAGSVRARLYVPQGIAEPVGMVLVHGVHHLGIEEPRLTHFAHAFAQSGITVLTPEVSELADYRIDPQSIQTIGEATHFLCQRLHRDSVGVMGISFAGGLSLLTAADPRYSRHINFVVAVGAHDDLARVSRFLATDRIELPDGSMKQLVAHQYGALVLVYSHLEDFFAPADQPAARIALKLWLWESFDAARAQEGRLSPTARSMMDALFNHQMDQVRPQLLEEVDKHQILMQQVSPAGHLKQVQVPVFLLHGEGDNVIPASETEWLAQELPAESLRTKLITTAFGHVDMQQQISWRERWQLVSFMTAILQQAQQEKTASSKPSPEGPPSSS
jgi:dienelactone hydrolase